MSAFSERKEKTVLRNVSQGPLGLGDPNDTHLRHVEREILIPKMMRDKAKSEKCIEEVKAFQECCKETGVLMVMKCRSENSALKECLTNWYNNEEFKKQCTEEYLAERSFYRRTGQRAAQKRKDSTTF